MYQKSQNYSWPMTRKRPETGRHAAGGGDTTGWHCHFRSSRTGLERAQHGHAVRKLFGGQGDTRDVIVSET